MGVSVSVEGRYGQGVRREVEGWGGGRLWVADGALENWGGGGEKVRY